MSKPMKRALPPAQDNTKTTKRPANSTTIPTTTTSQQPVKLSVNSNIKQQQVDAIISLKNKALKEPALFPLHVKTLLSHLTVDNLTQSPLEVTTTLQSLSTVYQHHLSKGTLYCTPGKIPTTFDTKTIEIETKKTKQFISFIASIATLLRQSPVQFKDIHKVCWKVGFEMVTAVGNIDTDVISQDSPNNIFATLLFSYFSSNVITPIMIEDFTITKLNPFDDIRFYTYQFISNILSLQQDSTYANSQHWSRQLSDCNDPTLRLNLLQLLSNAKFSLVTGKRLIKNAVVSNSMSEYSQKQSNLLSNIWFSFFKTIKIGEKTRTLGYISQDPAFIQQKPLYDDISIFSRIFSIMDTHILPNISKPLLLADFLSSSFNQGGMVAVQALNGLFTLMHKHKLEYPNFFNQLYNICTLDVLYSTYSYSYFKLLNMVLSGNYIPLYLVIAFMKKLVRLSLFGPSTTTIYITALMFNLYRKHPMTAYLINRKATIVQGIAKNAQMSDDLAIKPTVETDSSDDTVGPQIPKSLENKNIQPVPEDSKGSDEDKMDDAPQVNLFSLLKASKTAPKVSKTDRFLSSLSLTTTPAPIATGPKKKIIGAGKDDVKKSEIVQNPNDVTAQHVESKWLNGQDPFLIDIFGLKPINPENTNGRSSSLIELKDLVSHFHQLVRTNAKLLFDDNAPKHPSDISHLLFYLSYHTIVQQALTYRAKHLIPTAFQKPLGLLGKSERIVDAEEKYDEEIRKRGEMLDNERNTIESIFMW